MTAIESLEKKLDEVFVKQLPAIPVGFKKWLVKYLPYINLVLAIFTLFAVLGLWRAAHNVNELVNSVNTLSQAYGGDTINTVNNIGFTFWIAIVFLVVEAVLYLAAFPGSRDKKKSGWNLMFYALLVNVVYGFVMIFSDYGGFSSFIGTLIGSAIGGYLLFQIRSSYTTAKAAVTKPRAKKAKA